MASKKRNKKNKRPQPKKRYGATNFIFLTFGFCWLSALGFYATEADFHSIFGFILTLVYLLVPAAVVLLIYNKNLLRFIEVEIHLNRWYLVALCLPLGLAVGSVYVSLLFPSISYSLTMQGYFDQLAKTIPADQIPQIVEGQLHPFWVISSQTMLMALTLNTFMALGEELGFRGLLLEEWKALGFWKSSLLSGLTWGIWYAPLVLLGYNFPQHPAAGAVIMLLWCLGVSPLVSWVRIKAHSIAAAALFHGALNGFASLTTLLLVGSTELTGGLLSVAGLLTLGLANLSLWFFSRKRPFPRVTRPEPRLARKPAR